MALLPICGGIMSRESCVSLRRSIAVTARWLRVPVPCTTHASRLGSGFVTNDFRERPARDQTVSAAKTRREKRCCADRSWRGASPYFTEADDEKDSGDTRGEGCLRSRDNLTAFLLDETADCSSSGRDFFRFLCKTLHIANDFVRTRCGPFTQQVYRTEVRKNDHTSPEWLRNCASYGGTVCRRLLGAFRCREYEYAAAARGKGGRDFRDRGAVQW